MDLVLHKKLLALQEENAILRKQIQDLQELSDKTINNYIRKAVIDGNVSGQNEGEFKVYSQLTDTPEGLKDKLKSISDKFKRRGDKRIEGIWRAMRMREHGQARNRNRNTNT